MLESSHLGERRARARRRRRRRFAAGLAALGALAIAIVVVASSAQPDPTATVAGAGSQGLAATDSPPTAAPTPSENSGAQLPPIGPAQPGVARVFQHGTSSRREVALTIDDGLCAACVARLINTLAATGAHATIFPNGRYARAWEPVASTMRRLVATGHLLVGNHTFLHRDARLESAAAFRADLENNESWIERTFGVTARPFFRPPYGAYSRSTLSVAGHAGYTKVILWSGTVADSRPQTVGYILDAVRHWARPGAIILMHGNYPSTSLALRQILSIVQERGLKPVTLKELLG
jgi:peptidoglycan/xylan/chitin deacetylase (PgdA/CDA1 family)